MEQTTPAETTAQPAKRGRPSNRQSVNNRQAIVKIAQADPLATQQEIADQVGVHRATVQQVLAKFGINQQELEEYRENQADILLGIQKRISENITTADIQKAPMRDKLVGLGIAIDKHRLITGQSTSNIASWIAVVKDAQAKLEPTVVVDR